ncbi:RAMP superfamily CRISPR-associated protein [Phascolarctobacterium succinatutens]|uniref:RAMP superfamily CRISPR-associated protein n=1 Tax=Phascolarctobacterium succinatutens TaxID=626940 RepID=UPI003AB0771F
MKKMKIEIELLSPLQLSSGREDIIHDSDAVHDSYGVPYFPGKRLKGLLYESALELVEMGAKFNKRDIDILFGNIGETKIRIDNFYLKGRTEAEDAEKIRSSWSYLENKYPEIFNTENVWQSYTEVRHQTKIDEATGTAEDKSLRNMRVVQKGLVFIGDIYLLDGANRINDDESIVEQALLNLRFAGSKRNRGFGRIKCKKYSKHN